MKIKAPFFVNGQWQWVTWTTKHGNTHAAIHEKAAELGATAWDYGQAQTENRP